MNARGKKPSTGAFDIRNIIGMLIGLYGVILIALGLFADPALEKTGGVNANLWAGIAMAAVGAILGIWAKTRPVVPAREVKTSPPSDF